MFRGNSFHTIDAKGRVIIPSRFRDVIRSGGGDGVMITRRRNGLYAYTYEEWSRIEAKILALEGKAEEFERFMRIFIGGACDCPCDKQGRILIPPTLRQPVELIKDIVVVGMLKRFEIWSRDHWEEEIRMEEEASQKEEVAAQISQIITIS